MQSLFNEVEAHCLPVSVDACELQSASDGLCHWSFIVDSITVLAAFRAAFQTAGCGWQAAGIETSSVLSSRGIWPCRKAKQAASKPHRRQHIPRCCEMFESWVLAEAVHRSFTLQDWGTILQ